MTQVDIREDGVVARPLPMVVGPTRPAPSVLARLAEPAPALTDPAFLAEYGHCLARFREVVGSASAEVVITPGTGTTGMEALAASFLRPGVPVLIASTGMWGDRWRDICTRMGVPARAPRSAVGRVPDPALIRRLLADCQALLITHVDSSSGVRCDVAELAAIARERGMPCLVDGMAGLGADEVDFDAWDIDAYLAGPSKGLAAPPGLAMVAIAGRAAARLRERDWTPTSYSLDLAPWLPAMAAAERGEPAYVQTPAGNLLLALAEALRLVLAEGVGARVARHARLRDILYTGLADLGVDLLAPEPGERPNGVTVCQVPNGVDEWRLLAAVADHGVLLQAGTYSRTGRGTFRIGHLGNVTEADIASTLAAVRAGLLDSRRDT